MQSLYSWYADSELLLSEELSESVLLGSWCMPPIAISYASLWLSRASSFQLDLASRISRKKSLMAVVYVYIIIVKLCFIWVHDCMSLPSVMLHDHYHFPELSCVHSRNQWIFCSLQLQFLLTCKETTLLNYSNYGQIIPLSAIYLYS